MLGFAAAASIVDTLLGSPFPDPDIVIDHNTQCPTVRSTPVPAQMWAVGPGADVGAVPAQMWAQSRRRCGRSPGAVP